jgi:hypothetical protein
MSNTLLEEAPSGVLPGDETTEPTTDAPKPARQRSAGGRRARPNVAAAESAEDGAPKERMFTQTEVVQMLKEMVLEERQKIKAELLTQFGSGGIVEPEFVEETESEVEASRPQTIVEGARINPRALRQLDPSLCYLLVQSDSVEYASNIDDYLDYPSPTNPMLSMYWIDSEDRRVTGHRGMLRLACKKVDHDIRKRREAEVAYEREKSQGLAKKTRARIPGGGEGMEVEIVDSYGVLPG